MIASIFGGGEAISQITADFRNNTQMGRYVIQQGNLQRVIDAGSKSSSKPINQLACGVENGLEKGKLSAQTAGRLVNSLIAFNAGNTVSSIQEGLAEQGVTGAK